MKHSRPAIQRLAIWFGFVALVGGAMVVIVSYGWSWGNVFRQASAAVFAQAQGAAQAMEQGQDLSGVVVHLQNTKNALFQVQTLLRQLSFLRPVPWVGRQWKTAFTLTESLQRGLQALQEVGTLLEQGRKDPQMSLGVALPELGEHLFKARHSLQEVRAVFNRARQESFWLKRIATPEWLTVFEQAEEFLTASQPLLEIAPQLLGFDEEKTYLLLLQNNEELRPTGGFIGTYGLVTLNKGKIKQLTIQDVYALDRFSPLRTRPLSPEPLRQYLEQARLYLRDANWDPDFPTSAKTILRFYEEELRYVPKADWPSSKIDGVLALTPEVIRPLLLLTGPLTVQDQTFTADNLTEALEYEVERNFSNRAVPKAQRKEILAELAQQLLTRLQNLPLEKVGQIFMILRTALEEKQLLLYFQDAQLQQAVSRYGWDGKIIAASGDFLYVVDANLFSLKTDPYVSRSIFYQVQKAGAALYGEVELVYVYPRPGPFWKTKGYRTFTRVYVPYGAILTSVSGAKKEEGKSAPGSITLTQEHDKSVWGFFLDVQAGQTRRVRLRYRLPEELGRQVVEQGVYQLHVQKQPGTLGHNLTVRVALDKVPKSWSPRSKVAKQEGKQVTWQTSLRADQMFKIEF